MKSLIMIGTIGAGKTTLSQALLGQQVRYEKTQAVEVRGKCILDTPGEYLERRQMLGALMTTSADADVVVLLQDPLDARCKYPPCYACSFAKEVIGVVTKLDLADEEQLKNAECKLNMAGAKKIFFVSGFTGEGINELLEYLKDESGTLSRQ